MPNHHDKIFRRTFGDPEHARGLLRNLLPTAIGEAADWSTLRRLDGSVVDEQLAERHTDLLFAVELASRTAYVFVLLEHQSTVDAWMPLRMLGYTLRIWEEYRQQHPDAKRLPLVCPLVVHHSKGGWRAPQRLSELLDVEEGLLSEVEEFVPDQRFSLLDLTAHDDEVLHEIVVSDLGALVASALKHAPYDPDFLEKFPQWVEAWRRAVAAPGGLESLGAVARYILEVCEQVAVEDFRKVLESAVSGEAAEAIMTTAEQLRQEGRAEGRVEGRIELVLKLLTLRFGALPAEAEARTRGLSMEELDGVAERVLSAASLDEVFN